MVSKAFTGGRGARRDICRSILDSLTPAKPSTLDPEGVLLDIDAAVPEALEAASARGWTQNVRLGDTVSPVESFAAEALARAGLSSLAPEML